MASEREPERAEVRALQREKERERRRLRDRQRRQNMSQEQREKHLARRRRNYQLRRLRAQNAQLAASQQTHLSTGTPASAPDPRMIKPSSSDFPQLELPMASTTQDIRGAQKMQNFPKRLRLTDVKLLARRLHRDGQNQAGGDVTTKDITAAICCASMKRLRLIHVKRLARSIKLNAK